MRVKGSIIQARLAFAKNRGASGMEQVLAALSPSTRESLDSILPNQWFPFEVLCEVTIAVDQVLGTGDLSLCEEMGRYACDANLPRLYRAFLSLGSIEFFLNRAAAAWRAHYDQGTIEVRRIGPKRVHLRMMGMPGPCHAQCLCVMGFIKRAGEITGNTSVSGGVTRCRERGDSLCELTGEWE
jgi:hypothetical protein